MGALPSYVVCASLTGPSAVDYLLVRPMEEAQCLMESSYSRYWRETWRGLDVGHRGAGSSFTHK